jgi:PHD/YefM family antitoxin component YafN of YafNO toxin-antitoxin module
MASVSADYARKHFRRLLKRAEGGEMIEIRQEDGPGAILLSADRWTGILETLDLLADEAAMAAIRAYRRGETRMLPLSALDD